MGIVKRNVKHKKNPIQILELKSRIKNFLGWLKDKLDVTEEIANELEERSIQMN